MLVMVLVKRDLTFLSHLTGRVTRLVDPVRDVGASVTA